MSITDELRAWFENAYTYGPFIGGEFPKKHAAPWFGWKPTIVEMLDRIDAEHEAACAEAYGNGVESVALPDMTAYVKLPVDADGVPIRPGDELVIFETGERICAYDIELYDDGRWLVCDDETMDSIHPDRLRHHHEPTVEDVLREFGKAWVEWVDGSPHDPIAEFAAKLRLAGDVE